MNDIDSIVLNFNDNTLSIINGSLALIMFGVALDLSINDFKKLLDFPKSFMVGLASQLIILPVVTLILIYIIQPQASLALGMILVASCPGGNISNFMSSLSKSNVALSIGMTSIVSILAVFVTPFNLKLYGNWYEPSAEILKKVSLSWMDMAYTITMIIVIPLILGMILKKYKPVLSAKLHHYLKILSIVFFLILVSLALFANLDNFMAYISIVFFIVIIHNGLALFFGYSIASLFRLPQRDRQTISIETGIQNSGLGLVLIFNFFEGLGGMAIIAAWWGIWHIITGLLISWWWSKKSSN